MTGSDSNDNDNDNAREAQPGPRDKDDSSESSGRSQLAREHTNTIIAAEERHELRRIATELTSVQGDDAVHGNEDGQDEALNPLSTAFDLSRWLGNFIQKIQAQGQPRVHPGVVFERLTVSGSAPDLQVQQTVGMWLRAPLRAPQKVLSLSGGRRAPNKTILHGFDGLLEGGELLVVLGRPGSGCSTLLKTICGELHGGGGLHVDAGSTIHYSGVPQAKMMREFRGETVYNQEVDKHFPELTVGQTLEFAASVRMPARHWGRIGRRESARYVAQVVMAVCGLSHTYNTKVGNEFVRGVSGGERKRVSIAEMMVAGSPIMAWDNSTRGLDSATALRFVQTLRVAADLSGSAHAVAAYQASESIFALFDKAVVLMEGRAVFFGPASAGRPYFERQGWQCPQRQTTGDFLTSVTNPMERRARPGMEDRVPRTAVEFEAAWRASPEFAALQAQIAAYQQRFPVDALGPTAARLREAKTFKQSRHVRPASPYLISLGTQVALNTRRAYQRTRNDLTPALTTAVTCLVLALIIGSVVYGTPADATAGFYAKSSVIFMAVLLNALITITEINSLYAQRPVVEKHASYAFYHPATEAVAGIVADVPVKLVVACIFNVLIYFLAGLRRAPSQFFVYFLFSYTATFTMAAIFRTMAAMTRTIAQAMSLAGVFVLALVMYTGFVVSVPDMHPWFGWLRWLNPLFYTFEALVANEFHGRNFTCSVLVPAYTPPVGGGGGDSWVCSAVGAVAGQDYVSGDAYIAASYRYAYAHVWRNFAILVAFLLFFMASYFVATEINSSPASTGEMLVYQEGHVPAPLREAAAAEHDVEKGSSGRSRSRSRSRSIHALDAVTNVHHGIQPQHDIFTWQHVVYDIQVQGEDRRLLSDVSGWVKPGTLTALMGVSGAGKTTLLDVLAERTTMGVISGDMLVNGKARGANFQRSTGYVQQQDLHLETATVRESLQFSAMLRQPQSVSKAEKYEFVEEVIAMLGMEDFADAVVGIPGEGLNVEQRKLLTIGVELAAKPKLLLFLDEPTSGLDAQSSWAICAFLRRLADAGQAILCTIHQPSAVLFEQFDRLLFLAQGGRTVYFGDVGGADSRVLLGYFAAQGARPCGHVENPAEYMLEVVNETTAADGRDWHQTWSTSAERAAVDVEIARIHADQEKSSQDKSDPTTTTTTTGSYAMPFGLQLLLVTHRIFQQYWRMPHYIVAKLALGLAAGLFIGFTFWHARHTIAGTQDLVFSVFQVVTIFTSLVQQIQPLFVTQRALYEVRERPGKMYSWVAFMVANIVVEFPYQILTAVVTYACYSYPIVGVQSPQRQGLVLLFMIQLFIYASTFAHMCIAALPDARTAGGIVTLIVMMSIIFSGVLQTPTALPGFWIFMYRVSPFTYWISGVIATQVHGRPVTCSARETSVFNPPAGSTCGQYLAAYLEVAPGTLQNPDDTAGCRYCRISVADEYLASSGIFWSDRWRNFGILWGYVAFNIFVAITTYYVFRVRRWSMPDLSLWWKKKKKQ